MHIKCVITASAQPGRVATLTLKHSWSKEKPLPGSEVAGWASPCNLHPEFLVQRTLQYDLGAHSFVAAAEAILGPDLANLHKAPFKPPADTPPALRRAQIQAQVNGGVSKAERKGARDHAVHFERTGEWSRFCEVYDRFIADWVVPHVGNVPILYQRKPILRVVLPDSVPPTKPHCDADYYHDSNEINFWMPFTRVWGSNTLWSESAPGKGDYAPFECGPGELVRFYGNRCRHYTLANDSGGTRVSIDFRVIPFHLYTPPTPFAERASKHALDIGTSKKGYYALAGEDRLDADARAALRRWRDDGQRIRKLEQQDQQDEEQAEDLHLVRSIASTTTT